MDNNNDMNKKLQQLEDLLKVHDWYYAMSDDNSYYKRGRKQFEEIWKLMNELEENGYFVESDGFIAPAATGSSVKGYMEVTDKHSEIGMDSGTMLVQTDKGQQTVQPGQSIRVAMAEVPSSNKKKKT